MDVITFVSQLLNGLASIESVRGVTSQAEGPTVRGRANFSEDLFLAFYYNQKTGTQAFALVKNDERIWGIDYETCVAGMSIPFKTPNCMLPSKLKLLFL